MNRTTLAQLALVLSFITACATNEGDGKGGGVDAGGGGGSGSGSGSGSGGGAVSPQAGQWIYAETTPVTNTCPGNVSQIEAGPFAIDQVASASFRIIPGDGTGPFTCQLSASTFSCPNRAAMTQTYPNAVVTMHATVHGTFTSNTHATGRQDATVECIGAGCNGLGATFPCQLSVDFAVQAN